MENNIRTFTIPFDLPSNVVPVAYRIPNIGEKYTIRDTVVVVCSKLTVNPRLIVRDIIPSFLPSGWFLWKTKQNVWCMSPDEPTPEKHHGWFTEETVSLHRLVWDEPDVDWLNSIVQNV